MNTENIHLTERSGKLVLDLETLRMQYRWLLSQDECVERDSLIEQVEKLLGYIEGNK